MEKYIIKCWVPVEEEEPTIYETYEDAVLDYSEVSELQPENKYEIIKI